MADTKETIAKVRAHGKEIQQVAVTRMLRELDSKVPYKTGKLHDSVKVRNTYGQSVFKTEIKYPSQIANYTNDGTQRHVIYARRAKALRFEIRGKTIFAKYVFHPGTKGTKWFSKTANQARWGMALRAAVRGRGANLSPRDFFGGL